MKKKQLMKQARDIPDEIIEQQIEQNGLTAADYYLYKMSGPAGNYLVCYRDQDGVEFVVMDDDDVNNFAVARYLLRYGVPAYPPGSTARETGTSGE